MTDFVKLHLRNLLRLINLAKVVTLGEAVIIPVSF